MKRALAISVLLAATLLGAAGLDELPEVIGSFRGKPLRRDDLSAPLSIAIAGLSRKEHPEELRLAVRGVVETHLCRQLLDQWLREAGLTPSAEIAERCIRERFSALPETQQQRMRSQIKDPDFQKKCAVELWASARYPGADEISDSAIEDYYRRNPDKFARPARIRLGIIRFTPDAQTLADNTRLRLLQGENFDRVAREVDPGSTEELTPEEAAVLRNFIGEMRVGAITPVVKTSCSLLIVKLKERVLVSMIPLEQASPAIRAELRSRRCTALLEQALKQELEPNLVIAL